jgi:hypothetical protein
VDRAAVDEVNCGDGIGGCGFNRGVGLVGDGVGTLGYLDDMISRMGVFKEALNAESNTPRVDANKLLVGIPVNAVPVGNTS